MTPVDSILGAAQPGLTLMPSHGAFVTVWLDGGSDARAALGVLVRAAQPPDGRAVVGVRARRWEAWTGAAPSGGSANGSVLGREGGRFRDSGGDAWAYLKATSAEGLEALLALFDKTVGPIASRTEVVRGALPSGGRILDHHVLDGTTSAGDAVSVAGRILASGDGREPGSCWALAQQFRVGWRAFGDLGLDEQQDLIGRDEDGVLLPEHRRRSHIKRVRALADDHSNLELVRQALPYGRAASGGGREEGIYFAAFAPDAHAFEELLRRMEGTPDAGADPLLDVVDSVGGGLFYVPSLTELGGGEGLDRADCDVAPLWDVRSANGLMFYNSRDYLRAMAAGDYAAGDPPSDRILGLLGKVFARWENKWYRTLDTPRVPPLERFLDPGEEDVLAAPVIVRRAHSFHRMLTRVWTTTELPLRRDTPAWKADLFRVDPDDVLVGVMPELSLGRGKEVMPYLTDEERLEGFLALLDETSSMGHVVPDHKLLLERGLGAIHADLREREAHAAGAQKDFYCAAALSLEGVQGYCENYAALCDAAGLTELGERMRRLATEPPRSFADAAQSVLNLHCCLHLVGEPVSIGRLDLLLGPFLADETDEEAQEVVDALWVKLGEKALHNRQNATDHSTYGTTAVAYSGGNFPQGDGINQWVQQVTVGGYLPNDDAEPQPASNRVTLLALRASRRLPLNAPVLSLRVHPGMDDALVHEAARSILSGGSHPILFQEDRMVHALSQTSGLPLDAARDYACDGCYEPMVAGRCEFAFSNVTVLDALECALNEGARFDLAGPVYLRGWKLSFRSPPAAEIASFEQLQELFAEHLRYFVVQFFNGVLQAYGNLAAYCPSPLLSAFVDGCVERGRDLSDGGARFHLIAPMFVSMATAIDSLYAIKKLVFDDDTAVATLPELVEALRSDWGHTISEPFQSELAGRLRGEEVAERYKQLRRRALELPRFGSGAAEVDAVGDWVIGLVCRLAQETLVEDPPPVIAENVERLRKLHGTDEDPWELTLQVGVGTFEAYVGDALSSGASADGRRAGQPYPSDLSPAPVPQDLAPIAQDPAARGAVPGTNRPIYSAMASYDTEAVNHGLSNAGPIDLNIREDFPLADLEEVIRQYAAGRIGGNLITLTCADPDTYAAAAPQPERYELVRVRTGGWTEFFTAMFPEHHLQHARRPWFVPEGVPEEGCSS